MPETKRPLKVFLCHASADKPKVRELYRTLKRRGVQPWLDAENLIPGQNWEMEIPKALLSSDAIIICLSPNSIDKEGYVQKEIKFALDKALEMPEGRIFLIPAKLEDCDLPFSLRQYQAVNLYEKEGYAKLMKALKLRASQLERNTVELPKEGEIIPEIKKVVEDKKSVEPQQEKLEPKTSESSHKSLSQSADVGDNVINAGEQEKPSLVKPEERRIETSKAIVEKPEPKKTKSQRKINTAIIVALIGLIGTVIAALLGSPIIEKWFSPSPVSTESATATITMTSQPVVPPKTIAPNQTPTEIFTPTSTVLPTEITDAKGVQMVLVPVGKFLMGNSADDTMALCLRFHSSSNCPVSKEYIDTDPSHLVYLDDFYMDKYEVTNSRYEACVNAGVCEPPKSTGSYNRSSYYGDSLYDNYPVIYIDWFQAKTYCEWRDGSVPTEAQWEMAARGIDARIFPWLGERISCNQANYSPIGRGSCVGDTTAVGSYEGGVSTYGLFDMAGNVKEWVADWYSNGYYQNSPSSNPLGPDSGQYEARVVRGGGWQWPEDGQSTFNRSFNKPDETGIDIGVRCAYPP